MVWNKKPILYENRSFIPQKTLYLPGYTMAAVTLRDITNGKFYRSAFPLLFISNTYYCTELLWQTSSADYATSTGDRV
jgi:hypothetical protein